MMTTIKLINTSITSYGDSLAEFPEDSSDGKESPCNLRETWVPSLS